MPRCSLPQFDVLAALWRALHYLSVEKIREACAGASSGHVFKMAFRSSTAGDCTKHCSGDGINNIRIVAKSRSSRAPRTCRGVNSSMAYLTVVLLCISALLERCDAMRCQTLARRQTDTYEQRFQMSRLNFSLPPRASNGAQVKNTSPEEGSAVQCSRFICSSVSSIRSARRAPDFEKISIHITWGSKAPSRNQRINARDLCSSEDYTRIGVTQTNRFIQLTEQLSVFIHSVYRPTFLFLPFQPYLSSMRLGCCSPHYPISSQQ